MQAAKQTTLVAFIRVQKREILKSCGRGEKYSFYFAI